MQFAGEVMSMRQTALKQGLGLEGGGGGAA